MNLGRDRGEQIVWLGPAAPGVPQVAPIINVSLLRVTLGVDIGGQVSSIHVRDERLIFVRTESVETAGGRMLGSAVDDFPRR